jgi:hypothetical protein
MEWWNSLQSMTSMEWAAWTQGVGTVLAFAAAVTIWAHSSRTQRNTDRQHQASLVAAWATDTQLMYSNASAVPVFEAEAIVVQQPAGKLTPHSVHFWAEVLPPTGGTPKPWPDGVELNYPHEAFPAVLIVAFRDSAGNRWSRLFGARLVRGHRMMEILQLEEMLLRHWSDMRGKERHAQLMKTLLSEYSAQQFVAVPQPDPQRASRLPRILTRWTRPDFARRDSKHSAPD